MNGGDAVMKGYYVIREADGWVYRVTARTHDNGFTMGPSAPLFSSLFDHSPNTIQKDTFFFLEGIVGKLSDHKYIHEIRKVAGQ